MGFKNDKEKFYLMEILREIGTWPGDDIEEHFYKDGEEISRPNDEETGVSQKTIYFENDGTKKYEINSDGSNTQIIEYEDGEEVEKFHLTEDELFDILKI